MAIKAARENLSREEIIDILKRNVSLYKNDTEFAEYFANLAYCLAECYGALPGQHSLSELDSDDPRSMVSMDEVAPPSEFLRPTSLPIAGPPMAPNPVSGPAPVTTGIPPGYQMPPTAAQRAAGKQAQGGPAQPSGNPANNTPTPRQNTGYIPPPGRDDLRPPTTFHRPAARPTAGEPGAFTPGQHYHTPPPIMGGPKSAPLGSKFDVNGPSLGSGSNETSFGVQRANYGDLTPQGEVGEQSGRMRVAPSDRTKVYKVIRSYQSTQSQMDANFCPVCGTDCEKERKCPNCGHLI